MPVTLGFTCGIGIVIATLQIKDFLGLEIAEMPASYVEKVPSYFDRTSSINWADTVVGGDFSGVNPVVPIALIVAGDICRR